MSASKRIIIADDDANDRYLIQWALGRAGLKGLVHFVRDGQQVIEVLKAKSDGETKVDPRLLLLDIRLPKADGFEVLEWLQNNREFRPAQVVIFSSSCDPKDMEKAKALGADEYLVKPVGLDAYMELVRDFEMRVF